MTVDAIVVDLDGVVLSTPALPMLAAGSEFADELLVLSEAIDDGRLSFERSIEVFSRLLVDLGVDEAQRRMSTVSLNRDVLRCLEREAHRCQVVSTLPREWIQPVTDQVPCPVIVSGARLEGGRVVGFDVVTDKAAIVRSHTDDGRTVVAVGSSTGDAAMLEAATLKVVFGEDPPAAVRELADYLTPTGKALWNLLTSL